jgi:hypothetical protein
MKNDEQKKMLEKALQAHLNIESLSSHISNLSTKLQDEQKEFKLISNKIVAQNDIEFPILVSYDNKSFVVKTEYDEFHERDYIFFEKVNNSIQL